MRGIAKCTKVTVRILLCLCFVFPCSRHVLSPVCLFCHVLLVFVLSGHVFSVFVLKLRPHLPPATSCFFQLPTTPALLITLFVCLISFSCVLLIPLV